MVTYSTYSAYGFIQHIFLLQVKKCLTVKLSIKILVFISMTFL